MRLGRTQRAILAYLEARGGEAHITPLTRASGTALAGYTYDEVVESLDRLRRRRIVWFGPFGLVGIEDPYHNSPGAPQEPK